MKVFKFGGASVKDADGIRNVGSIIQQYAHQPLVVVVSAMDKTTNALEELANLATCSQKGEALAQLERIRRFHFTVVEQLFGDQAGEVQVGLSIYLNELEQIVQGILLLRDFPDRVYDRIMAYGELLSSVILHRYLQHMAIHAHWVDSRNTILTDAQYKSANVLWAQTQDNIRQQVAPWVKQAVVVTQGFIGRTAEGHTTTLGREGSDFTASIYAHCLDAEAVSIWKDVPGVMNADPKKFPDAVILSRLSYEQAVEMTFYGASVIHPKTIKPLRNKRIPLHVKCFLDVQAPGTTISAFSEQEVDRLPTTLIKKQQSLIHIRPQDFSFMDEKMMRKVFNITSSLALQINLVQSTAISLTLCVDHKDGPLKEAMSKLEENFSVQLTTGLALKTILNCDISKLHAPLDAILVQRDGGNIFMVVVA